MKTLLRASDIKPEDILDRFLKARLANKLDKMSDDDLKILQRMEYADDIMRSGGKYMVYGTVVTEMVARFADQHQVSQRTLENDIARAKKFFMSRYRRDEKDYDRGVRVDWLNKIAAEAYDEGDYKSAIAAIKEGNELLGLKSEEPETYDPSKIQPAHILVVADPTAIGLPQIDDLEKKIELLHLPKDLYRKHYAEAFDEVEDLNELEGDDDGGL